MNWKKFFQVDRGKMIIFFITIILLILISNAMLSCFGCPKYLNLPFPVKIISCSTMNCDYSFKWLGLIYNIIIWFTIYFLISLIKYKKVIK
jgi:hypothetical protein